MRGVPAEGAWAVAIDDSLTLGLERGGLATSGRDRRRWRRGQEERHHLIDPATGRSAATDLLRVTVIGRTAVDAEVLAKVLFLGGSAEALARDVPAVLVTADGRTLTTGGPRVMHHDPTFWLLARASGVTAYVLLTLSVLAGLVLKSRPFARFRAATVAEVHKTLALTGLGALALHAVALVLDTTVKVSLPALLVPGLVAYRPAAVAAGVIAAWLLVLITASFWVRKRIGMRMWRRLHWFTYALFGLATIHGASPPGRTPRARGCTRSTSAPPDRS